MNFIKHHLIKYNLFTVLHLEFIVILETTFCGLKEPSVLEVEWPECWLEYIKQGHASIKNFWYNYHANIELKLKLKPIVCVNELNR